MGAQENNKKAPIEKNCVKKIFGKEKEAEINILNPLQTSKIFLPQFQKTQTLLQLMKRKKKLSAVKKHLLQFHKNKIQTKSLFHKREKNHSQLSKENPNYSSVS